MVSAISYSTLRWWQISAPAVWRSDGRTWLFTATGSSTRGWTLSGGRLQLAWQKAAAGTNFLPVLEIDGWVPRPPDMPKDPRIATNGGPRKPAEKPEPKQKKKDAERFPGAVRNLAAAARRYQPALKTLADRVTDAIVRATRADTAYQRLLKRRQ